MFFRRLWLQVGALALLILVVFLLPQKEPCEVVRREVEVRGVSLSGLIEEGELVVLEQGAYACNPILRKDVVAYRFAGKSEPIIKIVQGVPGDNFLVEPFQNKGYHLRLNGALLLTTNNVPYLFTEERAKVLKLYEESYHGVIPNESYLILGNDPAGTVDSSRFGFVHQSDIIGRIDYLKK